jgi:dihydrofolate synthase/folylpolyglutamate synthase
VTVNLSEAFAYIESFTNFEKKTTMVEREYRLDRMRFLLSSFGNPERAFKTIHVAGSKGKGSTAAFAASILAASGEKTGLYTSPHVASYRERITVNGEEYPDGAYVSAVGRIRDFVESMDEADFPGGTSPTTFELLTLLGFLMFKESSCRWAVIETGIGGRLDATNLILPEVSVLTPIELEHTDILGSTIAAIAREKAGIIKPEFRSFPGPKPGSRGCLSKTSRECRVPITFVNEAVRFLKTVSRGKALRWRRCHRR